MIDPIVGRRQANPLRLSMAVERGRDIDGAWWPHADRVTNELPNLVAVLTPLLGSIDSINVNWSSLQRPPDLNWPGWERKHQHVMTLNGADSQANLLVISYATNSALAHMLLRCAAQLPIEVADRAKPAFVTAVSVLRAARQQRAVSEPRAGVLSPEQSVTVSVPSRSCARAKDRSEAMGDNVTEPPTAAMTKQG